MPGTPASNDHGLIDALAGIAVLLEDRASEKPIGTLYHQPVEVIACTSLDGLDEAFGRLEVWLDRGFHAAGLLSYELGYAFEPRLRRLLGDARRWPLMWFGIFNAPTIIAGDVLDRAFAGIGPPPPISLLEGTADRERHAAKVREVLAFIAAGDIYQANLTFLRHFRADCDPRKLYAALRVLQPVAHGGFVRMEGATVLSLSPELWVEVAGDRATMRPMKGTVPRGADRRSDEAAAHELVTDPKQRAENLMIVDLLRNDLSRIATVGSVTVPSLFACETYPTFHALTSTITARLEPGQTLKDRIEALFPCGSIVGVPKMRALDILHHLEGHERGFYTGGLGQISPDRSMRFNVAIRTAVLSDDGFGTYGVGGGIVADSEPYAEYDEALLKSKILTQLETDFGLIETLRWSPEAGFARLALHLGRLGHSARELGFTFDAAAIDHRLACFEHTDLTPSGCSQRVRLQLGRTGALQVSSTVLESVGEDPCRVGIARDRLDQGDPFLRHKTTRRQVYETAFTEAAALGLDEAVLLNRRGELAEGSRSTIFVEQEGWLATPPLECGVLPGVLRQSLLESGQARELTMTLDDLRRAEAWFIGSSLRGLRRATLSEEALLF